LQAMVNEGECRVSEAIASIVDTTTEARKIWRAHRAELAAVSVESYPKIQFPKGTSARDLLRAAIAYAETTYERDASGNVIGGDVEPEFVRVGKKLLSKGVVSI
jgi:hypothetical protein